MQAIMEPIFDVAYLVSVITIGIKMIRRSGGQVPPVYTFRMDGCNPGCRRFLPSGATHHRPVHHRFRGLRSSTGHRQMGDFRHHDDFLRADLLRMARTLQHHRSQKSDRLGIPAGRNSNRPVHDAAEPMDRRQSAAVLGNLSEHPVRLAGPADHRALLPQRQSAERPRLPLDVVHHRTELRLLPPGSSPRRNNPGNGRPDDSKNLRISVGRGHRLPRNEKRDAELISQKQFHKNNLQSKEVSVRTECGDLFLLFVKI